MHHATTYISFTHIPIYGAKRPTPGAAAEPPAAAAAAAAAPKRPPAPNAASEAPTPVRKRQKRDGVPEALAATPPPAPRPEPRVSTKKPSTGGKGAWTAREWATGWVRWSPVLSKCNVHCRKHVGPTGQECKMDRSLAKGSFALSIAWLLRAESCDYDGHMLAKEELSGPDGFAERLGVRADLIQRAEDGDADVKQILELETAARDGNSDEPDEIDCPSYGASVLGKIFA